jgi:hypothetical protein
MNKNKKQNNTEQNKTKSSSIISRISRRRQNENPRKQAHYFITFSHHIGRTSIIICRIHESKYTRLAL